MLHSDPNRTLEELEGENWGEPDYESHLVTECHRLRRVPLNEFTAENLRIMIRQNIGLPQLVPLALERLRVEPLTEGDFYPGDLLESVLRSSPELWREHPDLRHPVQQIADRALESLRARHQQEQQEFKTTLEALTEAYDVFRRGQTGTPQEDG